MTVDPSVHPRSPPNIERASAPASALRTEALTVRFGGLTALNNVSVLNGGIGVLNGSNVLSGNKTSVSGILPVSLKNINILSGILGGGSHGCGCN